MKSARLAFALGLAITLLGASTIYWHAQYVKTVQLATEIVKSEHAAEVQYMQTPVSVIGIVSCDKYMGTMIITGDGQIHEEALTGEDAHKIAEKLDSGASVLAKLPCQGQGT